MQVITTKYVGPTHTKGSRMCASAGAGKFYIPFNYDLDSTANHQAAALNMVTKLDNAFGNWHGEWVASESVTGEVYWCNATWATNRMVIGKNPNR